VLQVLSLSLTPSYARCGAKNPIKMSKLFFFNTTAAAAAAAMCVYESRPKRIVYHPNGDHKSDYPHSFSTGRHYTIVKLSKYARNLNRWEWIFKLTLMSFRSLSLSFLYKSNFHYISSHKSLISTVSLQSDLANQIREREREKQQLSSLVREFYVRE
jgi:hypothetical protein